MSRIDTLNRRYGSFFSGCADFAIAPYSLTFELFAGNKWSNADFDEVVWGVCACAIFTFAFPILPALTNITVSLALIGAAIGIVTAILIYPIALLLDLISPQDQYQFRSAFDAEVQVPAYTGYVPQPAYNPESDEYQGYPSTDYGFGYASAF